MNTIAIIEKYYKKDSDLYTMLLWHSTDVMNKSVSIAEAHPELSADIAFLKEASMIHDIGMLYTYAPDIHLNGVMPYIAHGYLGREMLDREGFPAHALVCERHTGVGITVEDIVMHQLPLPLRDMVPLSIEEKIICFADCFFSKTRLGEEKSVEEVRKGFTKYGESSVKQFDLWCQIFL